MYDQTLLTIDLGLRRTILFLFLIADVQCPINGANFLRKSGLIVDLSCWKLRDSSASLTAQCRVTSISSIGLRLQLPADNVFTDLLRQFPVLHQQSSEFPDPNCDITHYLVTKGPPVTTRPRLLPPGKLATAKAEFKNMLRLGIV